MFSEESTENQVLSEERPPSCNKTAFSAFSEITGKTETELLEKHTDTLVDERIFVWNSCKQNALLIECRWEPFDKSKGHLFVYRIGEIIHSCYMLHEEMEVGFHKKTHVVDSPILENLTNNRNYILCSDGERAIGKILQKIWKEEGLPAFPIERFIISTLHKAIKQ